MKILFLVPYPTEGASNRIRVEQFIPYLESRGISCKVRPFMNTPFYRILYSPGKIFEKGFWFVICTLNRLLDMIRAFYYDVVFIHREAYPLGGPFIETVLSWTGKTIVFDFDDAIFLPNTSRQNIRIEKFKRPSKIAKIINMSRLVIVGNSYLGEYAERFNKNTFVIPSSVDTDTYKPSTESRHGAEIVIGWIGSNTTKAFLYDIEDVFVALARRYNNVVFKIVGATFYSDRLKNVVNVKWSLANEPRDIQSFDIGIMPMPDNEWTKGKCGYKALLYMACGIPVVVSPVGVNTEIVEEGVSGYLADEKDEWIRKIAILIDDPDKRKAMGRIGREKVMRKYSLAVLAPEYYINVVERCRV
ncbi:MAG: glycosyltransferase family 4 protein [Candidatus Omnitrophota bacterium]|jgi:glycosyltransferase involved in cell wall biosynthesis